MALSKKLPALDDDVQNLLIHAYMRLISPFDFSGPHRDRSSFLPRYFYYKCQDDIAIPRSTSSIVGRGDS